MRTRLLVCFLVAHVAAGCDEERTGLTSDDLRAIDELRSALVNAIETGDAVAYADICTDDVQLLHAGSPIISGSAALEAHNAKIFEAVSVSSLVLTPVVIYGTGDLAYEVGTQALTIQPTVSKFAGSRKYVHVFRQGGDGQWRIAALMSNNN